MRRHFGHNPSYDCIHCCKCRTRVALVDDYILTVPAYVPGGLFNRLHKLSFWDDVPLFRLDANVEIDDEHLDANEENDDQDGDANEENDDQDRVSNEQDLGANEQNADQDGVTNETGWNKEIDTEVCTCLSSGTAEHVCVNLLIDMKGAQALKFTAA
ncbi:hypothetical protein HAX54_042613 [Datura stramonium]|uniref:Yippee domain-containing protein n=1 Tax=Datura stramonium TaxID=4076 RepID=A0ABS8RS97_DATST|nr:hypothetical protein [Datura stramonium]